MGFKRFSIDGVRVLIAAATGSCILLLLMTPRPVNPHENPGVATPLRYSEAPRPGSTRAADPTLSRLLDEEGHAEVGSEDADSYRARHAALAHRVDELTAADLDTLRKARLENLWPALRGQLSDIQASATLGSFPEMLERYGATRGQHLLAAHVVVEAMFMARTNAILGQPLTAAMSREHETAYWGWLVMTVENPPSDVWQTAYDRFKDLGGAGARERLVMQLMKGERFSEAAELAQSTFADTGNIRVRNFGLAAIRDL